MKTKTDTTSGITFSVHEVEPATEPLEEKKLRDTLRRLISINFQNPNYDEIFACSGYNSDAVADVTLHPLISAVHLSFKDHRPLILSPDIIWVTILQGLTQHIKNDPERFRDYLVSHSGKETVTVFVPDLFIDSPESAWDLAIGKFADAVAARVGGKFNNLESDFSTTGDIEKLACQVVLLDAFESYFELFLFTGCGIPEITLEGSQSDWRKLREKIEYLRPFDLGWWIDHLVEIADQFVRASAGDIDKSFWQSIYKLKDQYGPSRINGWIIKLIPYLEESVTGTYTVRNPILLKSDWTIDDFSSGVVYDGLPSGVSSFPFKFQDMELNIHDLQMLGGFTGVSQDKETFALKPILGWALKKAPPQAEILNNLSSDCKLEEPLSVHEYNKIVSECTREGLLMTWPANFLSIYKLANGIARDSVSIRPMEKLEAIRWSKMDELITGLKQDDFLDTLNSWVVFGDFADGTRAVLELEYKSNRIYRIDDTKAEVISDSLESFIDEFFRE